MKDLYKLAAECERELANIGIRTGYVTNYSVNTRAKSFWGRCKKRYYGDTVMFSIEITSRLMGDNVSDKAIKTTILHELLHTCPDCFCHTGEWKRLADKVNNTYGYDIKRATDCYEKGVAPAEPAKTHYIITCGKCNHKWEYKRSCDTVKACQNGTARCSCGGRDFKVIHI